MKRRFLALACAVTMVLGMSMTVLAASPTGSSSVTAKAAAKNAVMSTGTQNFTAATVAEFATVTTADGATVTAVSTSIAASAVAEANALYGDSSFVATVVDISLPEGTVFPYALTIKNPNVWAGQTVTVLHYVNGQWERLTPSKVANNAVTVTINSCSPFAIVIDTEASPKTMDIALMVSGFAGLFAAGAVMTGKRKEQE